MGKLFRTDGVRGVANIQLTADLALRLGAATASVLVEESGGRPRIVIGRDTRVSGDMLEAAFSAGACSSGADVDLAGIIPTPAIAFLTRSRGADGGVVISASHNPIADNGIKIFSARGFKIPDDMEERIEARVLGEVPLVTAPTGVDLGRMRRLGEAEDLYAEYIFAQLPEGALEGMKVVLDCACGAAWHVAPRVFRRLGAEVIALHDEPDGSLINVRCGSTDLSALSGRVVDEGASLGLAFDGDADRCLAVDETGSRVDGDQMLLAFARSLRDSGSSAPRILVSTVMSNLGLEISLRELGFEMRRADVGDRFVLEEMLRCGSVLGGEQSGHVIFLDRSTTGDGLLTATKLAHTVRLSGTTLSDLTRMPQVPQLLVNVVTPHKDRLDEDAEINAAIAEVENTLSGRGRLLVRPSGTEPMVRVMAEGPDAEELQRVVNHLVKIIAQRLG